MQSIPELQRADSGVWYVHWTEQRRSKRVSTRTRDLAAAKAFLAQWLLMEQASPSRADGAALTVADLWAVYEAKHLEVHAMAAETAAFSWRNLAPHFGRRRLADITADMVDDYVRLRAAGKIGRPSRSSTVRRELNALRACWNWCASPKRKIIATADIPAFDLPADGAPRDRWLRHDEIQRLLDAAAGRRQGERLSRGERFLWLALETGARKEAILQLTWDRVDFETGTIDYNVPGRRLTKKRRAVVPISPSLRPVLERARVERVGDLVMDNGADVWRIVRDIAAAAGVAGVSPHVLRHTAATHMARRGVPLWTIAKVLANTLAMVERVYAKHAPDDLRDAVGMISGGALVAAE